MSQWPRENMIPLQPPKVVKQPGRPKHSRNKPVDEVVTVGKKDKLRKWVKMHCGWCGEADHNVRTCEKKASGLPKVKVSRRGKGSRRQVPVETSQDQGDGQVEDNLDQVPHAIDNPEEHLEDHPDFEFVENHEDHPQEQPLHPDIISQSTYATQETEPTLDTQEQQEQFDDDVTITGVAKNPKVNAQANAREQRQARRYELRRQARLGGEGTSNRGGKRQRKK